MSPPSHQNPDPQQPDASSSVEYQAGAFNVYSDMSAVPSDGNRVIQGNSNRAIQGDSNRAVQGDGNQVIQGDNNRISHTYIYQSQQEVSSGTQLTPQEYRNRQALLTKVKNFWVKGVLEKSLHNQVLIELGLEERPDAVNHPWNIVMEMEDESSKPLPQGTKIINIFDQIGAGRTLLILGEPGSGKTMTLLELTRDLIARAEQDVNHLIPVVFNLSSWANKRQKIAEWLIEELNTKYQVPKKIGQPWLKQQQLLPLLDGLDEVKAVYREPCIDALNAFHQEYGSELVVCSRIKDYKALSNRLNFQKAVSLRALTLEQVNYYLDNIGSNFTGLRALIEEDTVLQELANSPLMLNIMVLTYEGVALEDLPKPEIVEERRKQLFDIYIEKMFKRLRTPKQYPEKQAKHWLIWLADQMSQSQTIFLIEHLQPSYLHSKKAFISYKIGVFFISGLITGLITGLIYGAIFLVTLPHKSLNLVISSATTMGLLGGIAGGLAGGWGQATIKTVETLKWSWQAAWEGLKLPLLCLLVFLSFLIVVFLFYFT